MLGLCRCRVVRVSEELAVEVKTTPD